ncbi:MAG: rhomboid family intramembrane serine protease [Proteobacteria bacterium]|nr:rhomboid family intramembrane serine protease [Pseudomonadota bacterium]
MAAKDSTLDAHSYFERHPEQAFILKALVTIAVIFTFREFLNGSFIFLLFIVLPVFFIPGVLAWSAYSGDGVMEIIKRNITLIPVMLSTGEKKGKNLPLVTCSLVFINIAIFYLFQQNPAVSESLVGDNLVFLPRDPNLWNLPLSAVTSIFLHGSNAHLWGNMMFLWAVGTEVERRIGGKPFLKLYLATGIIAGLTFVSMHHIFLNRTGHALGASGAISGVMGIFAIRCYFSKMAFPIPILGILPVNIKVKMNSLVIIGLFFMLDLSDGIDQMSGGFSMVAHWAHLGGMISGAVLASLLKYGEGAIEERHEEIGMQRVKEGIGLKEGEDSLNIVIDKNPDNIEAILNIARLKSRHKRTEEGYELYHKAIRMMIASRPQKAADVYVEYYNRYQRGVEAALQFRIAGILYRRGDLDRAGRALEILAESQETPPDIKEKALFQVARVMDDMGLAEAAEMFYRRFVGAFPESSMSKKAKARLAT